ncbi:MAG: hypothetical protein ACE5FL_10425 [Myxococcota bacterium]
MMLERSGRLARRGHPAEAGGEALDLGPADALRPRLPMRVELGGRPWRLVLANAHRDASSERRPPA